MNWICFNHWKTVPVLYDGDVKSGLFEGWISNGPVFKWSGCSNGHSYSPNHSKTRPFKIRTFLSRFPMDFYQMAAICLELKWLCLRISDPIQNLYYLHSLRPLKIQTRLDLRSPLYITHLINKTFWWTQRLDV